MLTRSTGVMIAAQGTPDTVAPSGANPRARDQTVPSPYTVDYPVEDLFFASTPFATDSVSQSLLFCGLRALQITWQNMEILKELRRRAITIVIFRARHDKAKETEHTIKKDCASGDGDPCVLVARLNTALCSGASKGFPPYCEPPGEICCRVAPTAIILVTPARTSSFIPVICLMPPSQKGIAFRSVIRPKGPVPVGEWLNAVCVFDFKP